MVTKKVIEKKMVEYRTALENMLESYRVKLKYTNPNKTSKVIRLEGNIQSLNTAIQCFDDTFGQPKEEQPDDKE